MQVARVLWESRYGPGRLPNRSMSADDARMEAKMEASKCGRDGDIGNLCATYIEVIYHSYEPRLLPTFLFP